MWHTWRGTRLSAWGSTRQAGAVDSGTDSPAQGLGQVCPLLAIMVEDGRELWALSRDRSLGLALHARPPNPRPTPTWPC